MIYMLYSTIEKDIYDFVHHSLLNNEWVLLKNGVFFCQELNLKVCIVRDYEDVNLTIERNGISYIYSIPFIPINSGELRIKRLVNAVDSMYRQKKFEHESKKKSNFLAQQLNAQNLLLDGWNYENDYMKTMHFSKKGKVIFLSSENGLHDKFKTMDELYANFDKLPNEYIPIE